MPVPPERKPNRSPGPSLRPYWIIAAFVFIISLMASIGMIVQTMNWLRLNGPGLPSWYSPVTTFSEWGLTLSSAGLVLLTVLTVYRSYRNK